MGSSVLRCAKALGEAQGDDQGSHGQGTGALGATAPLALAQAAITAAGHAGVCDLPRFARVLQPGALATVTAAAALRPDESGQLVLSCRPGGADDAFAANLAVGLNATDILVGRPCQTRPLCERNSWLCVFHQLLQLERELGGEWNFEENYNNQNGR